MQPEATAERLLKHGGARDSKFLVTHPMTDQPSLNFRDRTPKRTDRGAIEVNYLLLAGFTVIYNNGNDRSREKAKIVMEFSWNLIKNKL
jgi:hypothetical protein